MIDGAKAVEKAKQYVGHFPGIDFGLPEVNPSSGHWKVPVLAGQTSIGFVWVYFFNGSIDYARTTPQVAIVKSLRESGHV